MKLAKNFLKIVFFVGFYATMAGLLGACSAGSPYFSLSSVIPNKQYAPDAASDVNTQATKDSNEVIKIAILYSKKAVGRYGQNAANAATAYLLAQNVSFVLESFVSESEKDEDIARAANLARSAGFYRVLAILTHNGANALSRVAPSNMVFFVPSVHSEHTRENANIMYGGVDYRAQIAALSRLKSNQRAISFYDPGFIGATMDGAVRENNEQVLHSAAFASKDAINFSRDIKTISPMLKGSKVFINTPAGNVSLIVSQLSLNKIDTDGIYAPQAAYSQSLLNNTQAAERKNIFIANSIKVLSPNLIESARLLGVDLQYDWINYASAMGAEIFARGFNPALRRYFSEGANGNQIEYDIEILNPSEGRFIRVE